MNWGTGIAIVYGAFVVVMLTAVMRSRKHDPGLVQKDYYNLDLNYQAHMEARQNAASLSRDLEITHAAGQPSVAFQFPAELGAATGSAKFYRSATVDDDFTIALTPSADGQTQVPVQSLAAGRWHVEVNWEAAGRKFYKETSFTR